ncbi:MAG TPA: RDD family protein [Planctomycetota bacterium]|nr:RDD family protein [Planctomycetota bacterium]
MPCPNHPEINEGLVECWRCRKAYCPNCAVELHNYFFCTECKTAQVRDLLAGTDVFSIDYALMEWRFLAWLLDGVIKWAIYFAIYFSGVMVFSGLVGMGPRSRTDPFEALGALGVLLLFVTMGHVAGMLYEGFMLAHFDGQTVGKMVAKIKVVTAEGRPINSRQAWRRSALKLVMFFLGCECMVGIVIDAIFALGEERASLHDQAAQTRVVRV